MHSRRSSVLQRWARIQVRRQQGRAQVNRQQETCSFQDDPSSLHIPLEGSQHNGRDPTDQKGKHRRLKGRLGSLLGAVLYLVLRLLRLNGLCGSEVAQLLLKMLGAGGLWGCLRPCLHHKARYFTHSLKQNQHTRGFD